MSGKEKMSISARKADHLEICLSRDVNFKTLSTGFEDIQLMHCALPEMNLKDVDTSTEFFGKPLSLPLMVTGMTGGFAEAERVNRELARVCQGQRIGLGLGSQRQILENEEYLRSFSAVREEAPDIPLIGNVGGAQIAASGGEEFVERVLSVVQIDALAVHLNPLQEALQPEGDTNFSAVLSAIQQLVEELSLPIVVKETGAGISREVAVRLAEVGVAYIDVSGAGGTSWAAVEYYRGADRALAEKFWDWGIPTALCLKEIRDVPGVRVIASGGIRDGVDMAKAMALGAEMVGAAAPFLRALYATEGNAFDRLVEQWRRQFRMALFLTGCRRVEDLKSVRCFGKASFRQ